MKLIRSVFSVFGSLVLAGICAAQPVSIGVKGGVPVTDAFETFLGNQSSYVTNTKRYTLGPTVEFHLPARFSIEFDALYSRLGFDNRTTAPSYSVTRANSWQFPVLGKFEITPAPVRPFVDGGANIRHISGTQQFRQFVSGATFNAVTIDNPQEFNKSLDVGLTFGGGIAFKAGPIRLSP